MGPFIYTLLCGIVATILSVISYRREETPIVWIAVILGMADVATGVLKV